MMIKTLGGSYTVWQETWARGSIHDTQRTLAIASDIGASLDNFGKKTFLVPSINPLLPSSTDSKREGTSLRLSQLFSCIFGLAQRIGLINYGNLGFVHTGCLAVRCVAVSCGIRHKRHKMPHHRPRPVWTLPLDSMYLISPACAATQRTTTQPVWTNLYNSSGCIGMHTE